MHCARAMLWSNRALHMVNRCGPWLKMVLGEVLLRTVLPTAMCSFLASYPCYAQQCHAGARPPYSAVSMRPTQQHRRAGGGPGAAAAAVHRRVRATQAPSAPGRRLRSPGPGALRPCSGLQYTELPATRAVPCYVMQVCRVRTRVSEPLHTIVAEAGHVSKVILVLR